MLLNFSNHPFEKWQSEQKELANLHYGLVKDIAFPHIDPTASLQAITGISNEYLERILRSKPDTVHIMGEMTFTYIMVEVLRKHGIPCIASTTARKVIQNGPDKIVTFEFVMFRPYF